ncbi:2-hydroxycarboxylate transporter family protein [Treponema sp. OMZ 787]|uniref:2-hydroxycarboxylate transporter family protein n=1 Tax=Treponema sp. OMZ 787 TaxID=2563669 RepID=UPI0020A2B0B4|nr:2-hydroxycarboxylate transporter family protein [Treponema sp. OMZ 787]UTC62270.1 2-hydroxycarboxylate transporter family protein [Treponema sp. OMZ 787]
MVNEKKKYEILGMPLILFGIIAAVVIAATWWNKLPGGMIGALLLMMVLGEVLNIVGDNAPIVKTFFGGGPIVIIFASSALAYYHVLPEGILKNISTFMKGGGFLDFYIAALITGSILGMDRKLLIKAAIRYFPCIIGSVGLALIFVALGAPLFGMKATEAIAYIGIPIMGGGMGAGAVPIAQVFASALKIPAEQILSKLVPAVALGNALAIVAGGMLDKVGKIRPSWTGNGQLLASGTFEVPSDEAMQKNFSLQDFGIAIVIATAFFTWGNIVSNLLKLVGVNIHTYAWMIISVAVVKAANLLPKTFENACALWYKFVAKNFTAALLVGIGIAYTNLGDIIGAFSLSYIVLVFLVVLGAIIGAGIIGKLVGFYPIESAITAGLCMANMGGTGDVAVLTAAKRMELMPFAQISSRLGGAFIILLASFLVPLFFG